MNMALTVLRHTPPWAYGVFALLVWLGMKRMGTRTLSLPRVWTTPALLLTLSVTSALGRRQPAELTALAWLLGAALGVGPGLLTAPRRMEVDRANGRVRFPGSVFPLVRNLLIFSAQYALAVMSAYGGHGLAVWAIGVSGASAGYFLGWSGTFLARILRAPETPLAAQPA